MDLSSARTDETPKEPTHYRESFKKELEKLNAKQREAVETIEGPVLVIAGPGTGKTQILAARIGYILENADARPENILCLTYTDAGAIAMRKRLLQFIGPDAYRLTINTFHAFCNNIIQDNLDIFGIHDLELISDLEANALIRKMIDDFPLEHPLKRITGDAYYERRRMRALFSLMKKEGWDAEFICGKADEYLFSLSEREEFQYKRANKVKGIQKGDPKKDAIKKATEQMEQLKAAAHSFTQFREQLEKARRYDFDDMLLWVHDAFNKHPDLLLTCQERYQYVMVDEYQDTNGIQNQLLHQLIGYWETPNVFVVGDDDQSIYRFQGASVENILQFKNEFQESANVVVITENYRSTQHILDAAKALIENNRERLITAIPGLSKNLLAKGENAALDFQPEIREYASIAYETAHVAKEIIARKEQGVNLANIAVIYRKHRQAEDLAKFLEEHNIPVNLRRRANVLDTPLVTQIITILRYIDAETQYPHSGEYLLFDILHFNIFGINALVIARMALDMKSKRNLTWREEISRVGGKIKNELFEETDNRVWRNMKKLSDDLEYWIHESKNITVQQLLEKIVTRGGVLRYIMQSSDKLWLMQELTSFFDFVKSESAKNPRITIARIAETIRMMQQDEIELPVNKISYNEQGVNLVTAHASKGLEFDEVFLFGCTKDAWEKGAMSSGYKLPDNLVTQIATDGDEMEESRRLFYVALTRAKQRLYISYHTADNKMNPQEKCRFVAEISSATGITERRIELPDDDLVDFHELMLQEPAPPVLELIEESWLRKSLENYSLSVTHLNEYLRCPLSFYFKYVLKVPTAKNEHLAFGTAVHYALEQLFRKMTTANKTFPDADEFAGDFERSMHWQAEAFTAEQFKRRLEYGKEILPAYYKQYVNSWNKVISPERNIRTVAVNGVPLNGKLDKIEFEGKLVNVVDYKTGDPKNAKKKLIPQEGDYWRQAVFYRILIDNDRTTDWQFASAEIDFVQPDKEGKFLKTRIPVTDADVEIVTGEITRVYNSIMNLEFKNGCNDKDCDWCNFVKSRYQSVPEGEEVD